jgi:hypothetical protein
MIYYFALPFARVDGGLAAGDAVECPHAAATQAMSCNGANVGAIAFSRRGSPEIGAIEDAEILKTFGEVLDDFHFT